MSPLWYQGQPTSVAHAGAQPIAFRWQSREHAVVRISRHWRVHLDWWTLDELWRDYWELATDSGLLCILYHDLLSDAWYLERVYD